MSRRLLDTITIERKVRTVSPAGSVNETWTALATVRAQVLQRGFKERLESYGDLEESTIVFRAHALPIEITSADRIMFGGAELNLVDVQEIRRGRLRMIEIVCRKVAS